jgi:large subunit ribosomal protein L2
MVHNIEMTPGKGGQLVRAAGTCAKVLAREGGFVTLKLPSREFRQVDGRCYATLGSVSNPCHGNVVMGKAGRKRWLGRRPMTRGSAMNAADHPHGGGEGKAPIGKPQPLNLWGKATRCVKTRRQRKKGSERIVRRRVPRRRKK